MLSPSCLMFIKRKGQVSGIHPVRHRKHFAISQLLMAHPMSTDTSPISTPETDSALVAWMLQCKVGRFTDIDGSQLAALLVSPKNSELQTSRILKPVIRALWRPSYPCIDFICPREGKSTWRERTKGPCD